MTFLMNFASALAGIWCGLMLVGMVAYAFEWEGRRAARGVTDAVVTMMILPAAFLIARYCL